MLHVNRMRIGRRCQLSTARAVFKVTMQNRTPGHALGFSPYNSSATVPASGAYGAPLAGSAQHGSLAAGHTGQGAVRHGSRMSHEGSELFQPPYPRQSLRGGGYASGFEGGESYAAEYPARGPRKRRGGGRGGHRGRGRYDDQDTGRGRGRYDDQDTGGDFNQFDAQDGDLVPFVPKKYGNEDGGHGRGGGRGRGRGHPPGLKGREIGMYYASLSRGRGGKSAKKRSDPTMALDHETVNEVLRSSSLKVGHRSHSEDAGSPAAGRHGDGAAGTAAKRVDRWEDRCEDYSPKVTVAAGYQATSATASSVLPLASSLQGGGDECDNDDVVEVIDLTDYGVEETVGDEAMATADDGLTILIDDGDESDRGVGVVTESAAAGSSTGDGGSDFFEGIPAYTGRRVLDIRADNAELNEAMRKELLTKQETPRYLKMQETRQRLPTHGAKAKLLETIHNNQICVVSGDTGCGKTTQLCQYILDDAILNGNGSRCNVICTQPRRISAIAVANRVADERCEHLGSSVGYQIRLDSALPRERGGIAYCTTGVVLRWLISDPVLQRCSHLVLDEIHERNISSDFLMIIIKQLLPRRPDLKLILMSATLNKELFSEYFYNCPMVHVPGTAFPVQEYLLEDVVQMTGYRPSYATSQKAQAAVRQRGKNMREKAQERRDYEEYLHTPAMKQRYDHGVLDALFHCNTSEIDNEMILHVIKHICLKMEDGAILIFLPGMEAISKLNEAIREDQFFSREMFRIIPLHSLLPSGNQKEVFNHPPPGVRKIVIATNIAETSITIDDVVFVIDSGWMKETNYDESCYLQSLDRVMVTKANATQRAGRAGRVSPGHCFHLFSALHYYSMSDFQLPEMLRCSLDDLILQIRLLKLGSAEEILKKAMQPPTTEAIQSSLSSLRRLSAIDQKENLTALGYHLAQLPLEPHIGKLVIIGSIFSVVDPILTIAASLGYKDPFLCPIEKRGEADRAKRAFSVPGENSDHLVLVHAYEGWVKAADKKAYCWRNFLSSNTFEMIHKMKGQIAGMLRSAGLLRNGIPSDPAANVNSHNTRLVSAILVAGLYPRVARVQSFGHGRRPPKISTERHKKCSFSPASISHNVVQFPTQFAVFNKIMKSAAISIYDASFVTPFPLLFFGGQIAFDKVDDEGKSLVTVDDWIRFRAPARTARVVLDLRCQLDAVLWEVYRESHHSSSSASAGSGRTSPTMQAISTAAARNTTAAVGARGSGASGVNRAVLLQTIIDLISKEQASMPQQQQHQQQQGGERSPNTKSKYGGQDGYQQGPPRCGHHDDAHGRHAGRSHLPQHAAGGLPYDDRQPSAARHAGQYAHQAQDAPHDGQRGRGRKQHFNWREYC